MRCRRSAVVAVFGAALLGASASASATSIPSAPGPLLVPRFVGAPATADPIGSFPVPQNPHLAANPYNSMHDDAYGTNAYAGPGPLGRQPKVNSAFYGVEECATVVFDRAGRLLGLCINAFGPVLRLIDPTTLRRLAAKKLPGRKLGTANPLTDLCGGAYFYLDQNDRAVVATTTKTIEVVADTGSALKLRRTYDVSSAVRGQDCLVALMPDWAGHIWFVTGGGVVGTVDPGSGTVHSVQLPGEIIDNSFSVDGTGGVYIVSDHALYRFHSGPGGAPRITWRQPYDRGSAKKPGQLAQGSGTTPTLLGGDLVAITDNADPRMHVLVYRRSTGAHEAGCDARRRVVAHRDRHPHRPHRVQPAHRHRSGLQQPLRVDLSRPGRVGLHPDARRHGAGARHELAGSVRLVAYCGGDQAGEPLDERDAGCHGLVVLGECGEQ